MLEFRGQRLSVTFVKDPWKASVQEYACVGVGFLCARLGELNPASLSALGPYILLPPATLWKVHLNRKDFPGSLRSSSVSKMCPIANEGNPVL